MGKEMSVAALEAVQLEKTPPSGDHQTALTKAFFWAAKVFEIPWSIAVGADLRIPGTVGRRTTGPKLVNWHISKLHRAADNDPVSTLATEPATTCTSAEHDAFECCDPGYWWENLRPSRNAVA